MWLSMKLALRNLSQRPARTALTASMIVIGVVLAIWMMGTATGSYDLMIDGTTRGFLGHFQVTKGDYHDDPTLYKTVDDPMPLVEALSAVEGVQGVTTRIESGGLLALENRTVATGLLGVDPIRESQTTTLADNIAEGRWLPTGEIAEDESYPIVVGRGVANRLEATIGAELSFVGQGADGSIAAELFTVVGIYDGGSRNVDRSLAMVRIDHAQELLVLAGRVHRIVGTVDNSRALPQVMARMPSVPEPLQLADWVALNPELFELIKMDRESGTLMLWIVILVVVLGVANTMAMSVFERTRELGVMLALGTSPRRVVSVVLWEVGWLSTLAVALGIVLGALAVRYTNIPLPEPLEMAGVVFTHITGVNTWAWTVLNPLWVIVASLVSGLLPARRAARLNPVAAIRGIEA